MISTRKLSKLPDVDKLRGLLQSLAMLDAIVEPDWESRYYSFNAHWSPGQQLASMQNGEGDDFYAVFDSSGCLLKGFVHESFMNPDNDNPPVVWHGVLDFVPIEFAEHLSEPAFNMKYTTFCIWRRYIDTQWQCGDIDFPDGPDPDGSETLLSLLDGNPKSYQLWAKDYYERRIAIDVVQHIYKLLPLTEAVVTRLNPELSLSDLEADIAEIGYPINA